MESSLYCNQCRVRLTSSLTIVSGKDPSVVRPEIELRRPLMKTGLAFKSWEPMFWISAGWDHGLDFVPQYWLNPDDMADTVRDPVGKRGLGGCCGPTGLDGPNQACGRCQALVGTLQDDCSTPRVFIPDPKTTTWVEGAGDYWDYPA